MKNIFKKIAFVLALAMVVTMLPARAVSAADSDGPQMYKSLRLYLDNGNGKSSDITGTYASERYASVWNWRESGYSKVDFESKDENIATVNGRGKVTAVAVGTTTVTAVFTGDGVKSVVKECIVTVKKNATKAGLSTKSANKVQEEGIAVGEEYQLVAVRKAGPEGDEITVTSGRDEITDGVRFKSSDENIFTVGKTKGKITGVSEGTATLYVWGVQSEGFDPEAGEYRATTDVKEYTVKVYASIKAEQTAYNAFDVTFSSEEEAKKAVDETNKYLTSASHAVTEDKNIIKVSEVIKDTQDSQKKVGEEVRIIGSLKQMGDNPKVVRVVMFDELSEETDYVIRYMDYGDINVSTTKYIADKLVVEAGESSVTSESSSQTDIVVKLYAKGTEDQDVEITECRKYRGWQDGVVIYDRSEKQTGYNLVIGKEFYSNTDQRVKSVAKVYFSNRNASITVQAIFNDYFNEVNRGNVLPSEYVTIGAGDRSFLSGKILDWGIVTTGTSHKKDGAFSQKALATEDIGLQLIVNAQIICKDGSTLESCNCDTDPSLFTFRSENEDKLIINEETGDLYAPKQPNDTYVNVMVYYDGYYIESCPIKIYAKRELTSFSMTLDNTKLSHNNYSVNDVDDVIKLTLEPKDQMGKLFTDNTTVNVRMYGITSNDGYLTSYLKFYSDEGCNTEIIPDGEKLSVDLNPSGAYVVWIKGTDALPRAVRDIRLLGTVTSANNGIQKTLNSSTNFRAKNTTDESERSYEIKTDKGDNTVDMNLNGDPVWISSTNVTIKAYSIDKDGFRIAHLKLVSHDSSNLDNVAATNVVTVNQFGKYMDTTSHLTAAGNGYDVVFHTVAVNNEAYAVNTSVVNNFGLGNFLTTGMHTTVSGSAITVSGSAIGSAIDSTKAGHMLEKIQVGNYQVSLYVGKNYKAGSVVTVKDSEKVNWSWQDRSIEYSVYDISDVLDAIRSAFISSDIDTKLIYAGYIKEYNKTDEKITYVLKDDFVVQGEYISVRQIRYLREDSGTGYYYEVIIPISKTIQARIIH